MRLWFNRRLILAPALINWKKCEDDLRFYEKRRKAEIVSSISLTVSCSRCSVYLEQGGWHCHSPVPGTTLGISASSPHSFELYLWATVLYLDLFYAFNSEIRPKVTEKPKRGYFLGMEYSTFFLCKLKLIGIFLCFIPLLLRQGSIGTIYFQVVGKPMLYQLVDYL